MITPTERHFLGLGRGGFHRIRYFDWGDARAAETVVCVHGLTRNGHDFDRLAEHIVGRYRVVTIDIVGRGGSDWLRDPADYSYAQYQVDATALIARLDLDRVAPLLAEAAVSAEQAGRGPVEDRPELGEVVLDRRTGKGDT